MKAGPVELPRKVTIGQGLTMIIDNCLTQIQGNQAGVLRATDPEAIHQMRVGIRRLRSAIGLFPKGIDFPAPLRIELKWLAGEIGAARDADVLADSTLARMAAACPAETALRSLRQAVSAEALAKRQQAALALRSARYTRLMEGLASWLHDLRAQQTPTGKARPALAERLDGRAARSLVRWHRQLLECGQRLADASAEERHRVRIAAKKLRYAVEFFQSLHVPRRARRFLRKLAALQDVLGTLNDAAVADRLLLDLGKRQPKLVEEASFARGFLSGDVRGRTEELVRLWHEFSALDPY